jgi:hypothetical protein
MTISVNDKGDVLSLGDDGQWAPAQVAVNPKTGQKLAYDGKDWVEYGGKGIRRVDDTLRAVARGATLGYADEIGAGLNATVMSPFNDKSWKQNYDQNLTEQRQQDANFDASNPVLSTGAQIGGGVAASVAAPPLRALGAGGQALAAAPRYLKYGLLGTGGGGVAGFGESEGGLENRLGGAATGAAIGGLTGGTLPYVGDLIGGVARRVVNAIGSRTGARSAAARKMAEAATSDDVTAEQIRQRLGRLGEGATIADAGGPNMRGLAEQAANQPGVAQRMAQRTMEPRTASMGGRIYDSARENLGAKGDFYGTVDDLVDARGKIASPLYKEAFENNKVVASPAIDRILATEAGQDALKGAAKRMNTRMSLMGTPDKELTEIAGDLAARGEMAVPKGGVAAGLKLESLDLVKREFDDMIRAAEKRVHSGNARQGEVDDLRDLKKALVRELDDLDVTAKAGPNSLKPEGGAYARARAAYAGPSQSLDALALGRTFAKGDEELTARAVAELSPGERVFFREGVLQEIKTMMDSSADGIDKARKLIATPRIRDALREVFPDNASWGRFKMTLLAETKKAQTRNEVLKGSQTARRVAGQDQANIDVGGPITEAAQGNFLNAGKSLFSNITRSLTQMPPAERERLGQMLFSTDPAAQREALQLMGTRAQMMGISQARRALTAAGFGGARNVTSGLLAGD